MTFLLRDDPTRKLIHDELVAQAAQYLELRGWLVFRSHGPRNRPRDPGITDIIAMRRSANLLIEVKVGRDKQSRGQFDFLDKAIRCGLQVYVVRSIDDVIRIPDIGGAE